jgi:hypothetical protein
MSWGYHGGDDYFRGEKKLFPPFESVIRKKRPGSGSAAKGKKKQEKYFANQ